MTLDVKIGKIIIDKLDPDWDESCESTVVRPNVEQCPDIDYDLCVPLTGSPFDRTEKGFTCWPRSAYRSGSTPFWDFFRNHLPEIYNKMRDNPNSNDRDVARIAPLIKDIRALPDDCGSDIDNDRMKWFKFWCNRAVELYGDEAGVGFS